MIQFEGMERRMAGIEACLRENGLDSLEAAEALCKEHGIDVAAIVDVYKRQVMYRSPVRLAAGVAVQVMKSMLALGNRLAISLLNLVV